MIPKRYLADCNVCSLFSNSFVPNEENGSRICFVAEAPGKMEVEQGRPLVGPAGRILYKCIDELGYKRGTFDYQNSVLCRPVDLTPRGEKNRTPDKSDIKSCNARLLHETSKYDILIALGNTSYTALTGMNMSVNVFANDFVPRMALNDVPMLGTYHPAAVIYNRKAEDVMTELMKMTIKSAVDFSDYKNNI